jgi:hypothetical protein
MIEQNKQIVEINFKELFKNSDSISIGELIKISDSVRELNKRGLK